MAIRTRAFGGTPESAAYLQPWVGVAHPQQHGIPLGIDLRTGALLVIDPWLLRSEKVVSSLMTMVLGQKESGKSTLAKVLGMRLGALSAQDGQHLRIRANDRKPEDGQPEYAALTEFFRSDVITLRNHRVNIFDMALLREEAELLDTVVNVCEFSAEGPLTGYQPLAVQVGVFRMLRDFPGMVMPETLEAIIRRLDIQDVAEYYRSTDDRLKQSLVRYYSEQQLRRLSLDEAHRRREMIDRFRTELQRGHNINPQRFRDDASIVSTHLSRILYGDMGRMFGGSASLRPLLEQPSTTIDWTGLPSRGATLMRAILWKAQTAALVRNDMSIIPHFDVDDEDHSSWHDLMYARYKAEYAKIARAFPTMNLALTHRLADYSSVGEAGSEQRNLATNMINDIDLWFVGRQADGGDAVSNIKTRLDLSEPDARALTKLRTGQFLLKLGDIKPIFFQLVLVPIEVDIIRTNRATERMLQRMPVLDNPDVQRRLASGNNIKMIGE